MDARTSPVPGDVGKLFVKLVTVIDTAFGLLMVIVSFDVAPDPIGLD
jgi:hypothetical protein